jgi:hypothetical protein
LETIEQNGEFEKYVEMLAERQDKEQKDLRRRERERKRLEMGDDYVSEGSDEADSYDDEDSSEEEEEYDSEESNVNLNLVSLYSSYIES